MAPKVGYKKALSSKGHFERPVLIDEVDLHLFTDHSWSDNGGGYLRGMVDGKASYLHRVIMGAKPGQIVDHINRDTYDLRRSNLRFVTKKENCMNNRRRASAEDFVRNLGRPV